jgi:hypothetical protein
MPLRFLLGLTSMKNLPIALALLVGIVLGAVGAFAAWRSAGMEGLDEDAISFATVSARHGDLPPIGDARSSGACWKKLSDAIGVVVFRCAAGFYADVPNNNPDGRWDKWGNRSTG